MARWYYTRVETDICDSKRMINGLKVGDSQYYDFDANGFFDHTTVVTSFDTDGYSKVTYRNAAGYAPAKNVRWNTIASMEA